MSSIPAYGIALAAAAGMDTRTDQPAPHAGEKEKGAGVSDDPAAHREPIAAVGTSATPAGRRQTAPVTDRPGQGKPTPEELERDGFPKP